MLGIVMKRLKLRMILGMLATSATVFGGFGSCLGTDPKMAAEGEPEGYTFYGRYAE